MGYYTTHSDVISGKKSISKEFTLKKANIMETKQGLSQLHEWGSTDYFHVHIHLILGLFVLKDDT